MERERIKQIAVKLVKKDGLINLSRQGLCDAARIADGSFPHIMGGTFLEFVEELRAMRLPVKHTKVIKSRTHPVLRKEHILSTAVNLAAEIGFDSITRDAVAEKAGTSGGLVSQYFTMVQLKNAVMEQAVLNRVLAVIAQGIVAKHPRVRHLSGELKLKAVKSLTE